MHKGFAEEAIVIVKHLANEDMVTYLRVKPDESASDGRDEGRNMLT